MPVWNFWYQHGLAMQCLALTSYVRFQDTAIRKLSELTDDYEVSQSHQILSEEFLFRRNH
eukprot:2048635-Rhodomonas_salina.1